MRVFLIVSIALTSHSGPRRLVKLVGLSSPVMIRRRIGYLTRLIIVEWVLTARDIDPTLSHS